MKIGYLATIGSLMTIWYQTTGRRLVAIWYLTTIGYLMSNTKHGNDLSIHTMNPGTRASDSRAEVAVFEYAGVPDLLLPGLG